MTVSNSNTRDNYRNKNNKETGWYTAEKKLRLSYVTLAISSWDPSDVHRLNRIYT